jgi:hypothetical protein
MIYLPTHQIVNLDRCNPAKMSGLIHATFALLHEANKKKGHPLLEMPLIVK